MAALLTWLWAYLAGKLPLTSPAFYVNAISGAAFCLYLTGAWRLAPNNLAHVFGVVILLNLVANLAGHWVEQAIGRLGQ